MPASPGRIRRRRLWLRAPKAAVQKQIAAAMDARDEKPRHRHEVEQEIAFAMSRVSADDKWRDHPVGTLLADRVQRCRCGAVRRTYDAHPGEADVSPWVLCGEVAAVWRYPTGGDLPHEFAVEGRWDEAGERGELVDGTAVSGDAPMCDPDDDEYGGVRLTGWRRPYTWSEVKALAAGYGSTDCSTGLPAEDTAHG